MNNEPTILETLDEVADDLVKPHTRQAANVVREVARNITFGLLDDVEDSDDEKSWW